MLRMGRPWTSPELKKATNTATVVRRHLLGLLSSGMKVLDVAWRRQVVPGSGWSSGSMEDPRKTMSERP